eukprot:TRINITY_DN13821_c0_g1_i1.p1 TRINITY_DN13821_c0_g1~~TRINITY_DN13821_c0_g1_i1.p1  ORF type:complete len:345 (+),score=71.91 TRINITY_DN13821_c0_g1_i1:28-1062(+)
MSDETPEAEQIVEPSDSFAACTSDGDFVILWGGYTSVFSVVLKQGTITNNRFGNFHHDDLIGQQFGSKVRSRRGGQWLALLRPTSEFITQSLSHRTQIIYHADISLIRTLLDARPGRIICEAGTGSGSLSASLARALRPGGQLNTFEFHEQRQKEAAADFAKYGLSDIIRSHHRDVCKDGFDEALRGAAHGIFLDLPAPWLAIQHVDETLVPGGRLVTFSPCIEQIDKTATELRRGGRYHDIRMFESLAVNWGVKASDSSKSRKRRLEESASSSAAAAAASATVQEAKEQETQVDDAQQSSKAKDQASSATADRNGGWLSYQMPMRSHTSYILVATRAPADEPL